MPTSYDGPAIKGSLIELDAANGSLVREFSATTRGFDYPIAVAVDGENIWVANYDGNSVTELDAATGQSQVLG